MRIKPLEWENFEGAGLRGERGARANSILGVYHAYGDGSWSGRNGFTTKYDKSLDDGKASAQSDFERCILSALDQPKDDP